jgi:outer membrane immunogenic protein
MRIHKSAAAVALVGVLAANAAVAADLGPYRRGSIKDAPPPPAAYPMPQLTGLYKIQIGYGWAMPTRSQVRYRFRPDHATTPMVGRRPPPRQYQNLVYGIETDIEASSISGAGIGSLGYGHDAEIGWLGSTRGRLGIAYDRTLFYATAGWAYGDVKIDKGFASYSDVRSGWTAGVGAERAITDRMMVRLEYRYTDLGSSNFSSSAVNSIDKSEIDFHAVRAGLSFKF